MLNVSISIRNNANFQTVTRFASNVSQFLDIGLNDSLVNLILFTCHADVYFNVQEHFDETKLVANINSIIKLYDQIPRLNHTGTNIPEALDLLRTAGQNDGQLKLRNDATKPKIVFFVTDGWPNKRNLTGNSREVDTQNTKDAAARLQESGIYDQIYAVGIRGSRGINFEELDFIASDPSMVYIIDDFNQQLFERLQQNLTNAVCECKYNLVITRLSNLPAFRSINFAKVHNYM